MRFILPFAALLTLAGAIRAPGADTPEFYLVSTTTSPSINLLPVYINSGQATLSKTGQLGIFYFFQGSFVAAPPQGSSTVQNAIIELPFLTNCGTYGPLAFVQGSTTDKCASHGPFAIQSDTENSQLGASLVFNFTGGFYACGSTNDILYKFNPNDGPSGCSPVALYTVPVV